MDKDFIAKLIVVIFIGCLFLANISCERRSRASERVVITEPSEPVRNCPVPPGANAMYEEVMGPGGQVHVRIRGFWFHCEGIFGQSRLYCRWR